MKHRDCGGAIREDWQNGYRYDSNSETGEEAPYVTVPALVCEKCGAEIQGDAMLCDHEPEE